MNLDKYKEMLITNIKKDYLYDLHFEEGKELTINDLIDLPKDLDEYINTHEQFRDNVIVLLNRISKIMMLKTLTSYSGQKAVDEWYINTINKFQDCYREFIIACTDNGMDNAISKDNIYQISVKKSVLDVIKSTYDMMSKNQAKKAGIR